MKNGNVAPCNSGHLNWKGNLFFGGRGVKDVLQDTKDCTDIMPLSDLYCSSLLHCGQLSFISTVLTPASFYTHPVPSTALSNALRSQCSHELASHHPDDNVKLSWTHDKEKRWLLWVNAKESWAAEWNWVYDQLFARFLWTHGILRTLFLVLCSTLLLSLFFIFCFEFCYSLYLFAFPTRFSDSWG